MAAMHPKDMSPAEKETYHREAEAGIRTFKYETPVPNARPKQVAWLVKRPMINVFVQCVHKGGDNNLHYHTNSETTWMVLRGRARFVGVDGNLIADISAMEGVHIPGGSRYRFGSVGDEDLEILQIVAIEKGAQGGSERINYEGQPRSLAHDVSQSN